jgi:hypothetical protein
MAQIKSFSQQNKIKVENDTIKRWKIRSVFCIVKI